MNILRTAALAAVLLGATLAHADERWRYHDEAGLWVGLGIFADFIGASILADLISPPPPPYVGDACDPCPDEADADSDGGTLELPAYPEPRSGGSGRRRGG
jgi:hypothetical protein